jgi:CheY-like chemotaxis protein
MSDNRILLVDDQPSQRHYLARIIQRHLPKWKLTEVASEQAAIQEIERDAAFSAAVVDLYLTDAVEGREGLNVLHCLKQRNRDCLCILVTGRTREWDVPNDADVDEFISLHYTNEDVRSRLEEALERAREFTEFA